MKDIPMFTTENGVASLTLSQIPFTGKAYILLQASQDPMLLVQDCVKFCRMCDATSIYVSGSDFTGVYPEHTTVLKMCGSVQKEPETGISLWPMLPENKEKWRTIYNEAMRDVENAILLSYLDMNRMYSDGDCYFVHENQELLGIGKASNGRIHAIVSVAKGNGRKVLDALLSLPNMDEVTLSVASTNQRAIRLYEKAGFSVTGIEKIWWQIQ